MFRAVCSSPALSTSAVVAITQRRTVTKLHTSYTKGYLSLHSLTGPRAALSKGSSVSGAFRSPYRKEISLQKASSKDATEALDFGAAAEEVDVLEGKGGATTRATSAATTASRPYVPLGDVARIELQGDYLMEGGQPFDALKHYGVVAKAFQAAYPENDNQRASIAVKLSRAFRCCGMLDAAVANAENAIFMLDHNDAPHIDLVCEALLELGEAKDARKDVDAGLVYEDVSHFIDMYHSLGNTERTLRLMPRLGTRMGINHDKKFFYMSPFNTDRVFHLGDHAMDRAEQYYRRVKDQAGVVRVLEKRSQLVNSKLFELRNTSGRMRTLRGYSGIHKRNYGFSSTPRELFLYSPTVHQVYFDRSVMNRTPVGREDEAIPGANRRVMDDGNYVRHVRKLKGRIVKKTISVPGAVNSMSTIFDY